MQTQASDTETRNSLFARFDFVSSILPVNVKLISVSKKQPDNKIGWALDYGWRVFGENRLQEAELRWKERKVSFPDLELHFVGQLQSNKADRIVALFDAIHSLDRESAIKSVAAAIHKQDKHPKLFLQINTGDESQKGGLAISDIRDALYLCRDLKVHIDGLMCLPPKDQASGPHFGLMRKLAARHNLPNLSMGMTGDYQTAIKFGATHIRLGTSLFGERPE